MDYKILLIVILALTQLLTITVKALLNHIHRKNQKPLNPSGGVDYSGDIKECKDDIQAIEKDIKDHGERLATIEQALKDLTWKVCKGGSN